MKRCEMIKDKDRFSFIIKHGHYNKDKYFVVYDVLGNDATTTSFGIAVKKGLGGAVLRNRVKRQTRSIIDNNKKLFKKGKDYIIMIRDGCVEGKYAEMNASMVNLLKGKK